MQPISTSRCPERDQDRWFRYRARSRACQPCVAVRLARRPAKVRAEGAAIPHESPAPSGIVGTGAECHAPGRGMVEILRSIHDKIGAPAFFRIRHLPGEKASNLSSVMPGPLEGALALHVGRRRHHHDGIADAARRRSRTGAGCRAPRRARRGPAPRPETRPAPPHQRMHDGLQPAERGAVAEHQRRELAAIDLAAIGGAGKRALDRGGGLALIERCTTASASCTGTPASAKNLAVVDLPIPSEPVRPRTKGRDAAHASRHPRAAGIPAPQQRQAENGEMIAVDALEQLNAEAFDLIAADACRRRAPTASR